MSLRFVIRNTADQAEKEGNVIVRYSGVSETFNRHSERAVKKVGVDGAGNPKLVFVTGMDEKLVQFYNWYNEEEKALVVEQITELKKLISDYYGGDAVVDSSNQYFWKDDRNVNRLSLKNESIDVFFDTSKPVHALLYLSIISGAFIDLVAPTKDWAERYQIPHYLSLEKDTNLFEGDIEVTRSEAHAALNDLKKNHGKEALYILAWCLQYDTNAFGAYNYSVSEAELMSYHIKFINGLLVTKKKRNTAAQFIEYYEKWIGQQTRPLLITEAYIKAGDYYDFIIQREKKYTTSDGTILGNTVDDAVKSIMKPKFTLDYEKLRNSVEAKWKE